MLFLTSISEKESSIFASFFLSVSRGIWIKFVSLRFKIKAKIIEIKETGNQIEYNDSGNSNEKVP